MRCCRRERGIVLAVSPDTMTKTMLLALSLLLAPASASAQAVRVDTERPPARPALRIHHAPLPPLPAAAAVEESSGSWSRSFGIAGLVFGGVGVAGGIVMF